MTNIRYCKYYREDRKDPAFYTWDSPDWVATVEINDRLLEIWTAGEMRIVMPNEYIIRYTDDLIANGIFNDKMLHELVTDDDDFGVWQNNSWFELRDHEGQWISDVFMGTVYHDLDEAIANIEALLIDEEFLLEYPCLNPESVVV